MITLDYSNYLAGQKDWADSLKAQAAKTESARADELGRLAGAASQRIATLAAERVVNRPSLPASRR